VLPYSIRDFSFGNGRFPEATILLPLGRDIETDQYDGVIGRTMLSAYILYFDFAGRAIYLKPNSF